jgi:hypothetical protein
MVEHVPVLPHGRRATRAARQQRARSRLAGLGGVGAALGLTAAVVMAPMAQGSNPPRGLAPAVSPAAQHVDAVAAPTVDSVFTVTVPTITHNPPPPPPPKPKPAGVKRDQTGVSDVGDKRDRDCGDKYSDG